MPLTPLQTTQFFTQGTQMAIPAATMAAINNEGIVNVEDLEGIEKDDIETMAKNFRSPPAGQPVVVFGV